MDTNGHKPDGLELQIVVGSTRPGRAADRFLPWLRDRAERHGRFSVRWLDLRDWDLPFFGEPTEDMVAGRFSTAWSRRCRLRAMPRSRCSTWAAARAR